MPESHAGTPRGPGDRSDGSDGSDGPDGADGADGSVGGGSRWWLPGGAEVRRDRALIQAREIVEAFAALPEPITIRIHHGDDNEQEVDYLYQEGVILTRDEDAERVQRALGRDQVVLDKDVSGRRRDARSRPAGSRADGRLGGTAAGLFVIPLVGDEEALAVLDRLDDRLGRGIATPNHVVHVCPKASTCPASEPLPAGWYPDPAVNPDEEAGAGVRISVIDTGLLEDARTAWMHGVSGDPEQSTVGRYRGHGTFVAGVARAMAPSAEVDVEAFLFVGGGLLEADLADGLGRALDTMPDIISMSAGTRTRVGGELLALQVFWEKRLSQTKGTVLVCAAGNDGDRGPFYPATFPWSISVGALDVDGSRAGYSNFGSWVDVYTRGSDVVNAYPVGEYTYAEPPFIGLTTRFLTGLAGWSGTSFSTPLVAGLIAARMSWTGESARDAADVLLTMARANGRAGVGPVLEPGMGGPGS